MRSLLSLLGKAKEIQTVLKGIKAKPKEQLLLGLSGSQKACLLAALVQELSQSILVFTPNSGEASKLYDDLTTLLEIKVYLLPELDGEDLALLPKEFLISFCFALDKLLQGEKIVMVTPIKNLLLPLTPFTVLKEKQLNLELGKTLNVEELLSSLVEGGYEREEITESPGQFSVRGGIIDFFPYNALNPIRVELFDEEIDSIREFDPVNQRSFHNLPSLNINLLGPKSIFTQGDMAEDFLNFLEKKDLLVVDEPARCWEENEKIKETLHSAKINTLYLSFLELGMEKIDKQTSFRLSSIGVFQQRLDYFTQQLEEWRKKNTVFLLASTKERQERIKELLEQEGIGVITNPKEDLSIGQIALLKGNLNEGFHFPSAQVVVVADQEIFGVKKKKSHRTFREKFEQGIRLTSLEDLIPGDYVVHTSHGIGQYLGLETIESEGVKKDYLSLEYANKDKLYIPIEQMDMLQKYVGIEGQAPRLSKLGGSEWVRLKKKVKGSIQELAKELLELYAVRETTKGHAFPPDGVEQEKFEDAFPYEETQDQLRAIEEVKSDMESPLPMDRLLCGDVGYGKTEVAMRAVFKSVMDGRQVAILVPTTILAQQHLNTFQERFKDYAVNVEMLSRFRSPKEQQEIIKNVTRGTVDVIIGTHRLVQKDIQFKNLGLIVVDEEQRFGVAHKEKLKQLKRNVDVLTLTATPIPRTLYMSLVKIRNMSVIETPPEDRFPIQTYIMEYDEKIVKEAIVQEIERKGQVFFVHNRVETIDKVAQRLAFLVPQARIVVAHGQMGEDELENTMWDFIQGHYDVLVCTTIIETGLDVPNVNTLIIDDADKIGLSSLYQLRGRVGRSNRIAYAYLTYRKNKLLSEVAAKRLKAMRDFTALGSGFKIAMRDLEIRGAGNLLGAEQHGHITSVGFELYARMLQQAVDELRGQAEEVEETQPLIELKVNAHLPDSYIKEWKRKIEIYKKIAGVTNNNDVMEIEDELEDRFGQIPDEVTALLLVARIKLLARELNIDNIVQDKQKASINFKIGKIIKGDKLSALISRYRGKIMIVGKKAMQINVKSEGVAEKELLSTIKGILEEISEEGNSDEKK